MSHLTAGNSLNHRGAREGALASISRLIFRAIEGIVLRMREERTRRELMHLDEHMLRDIGLSRIDLGLRRLNELNRINWSAKGHPSRM